MKLIFLGVGIVLVMALAVSPGFAQSPSTTLKLSDAFRVTGPSRNPGFISGVALPRRHRQLRPGRWRGAAAAVVGWRGARWSRRQLRRSAAPAAAPAEPGGAAGSRCAPGAGAGGSCAWRSSGAGGRAAAVVAAAVEPEVVAGLRPCVPAGPGPACGSSSGRRNGYVGLARHENRSGRHTGRETGNGTSGDQHYVGPSCSGRMYSEVRMSCSESKCAVRKLDLTCDF